MTTSGSQKLAMRKRDPASDGVANMCARNKVVSTNRALAQIREANSSGDGKSSNLRTESLASSVASTGIAALRDPSGLRKRWKRRRTSARYPCSSRTAIRRPMIN